MPSLRIHYYDPDLVTGPNPEDRGAWRMLTTILEGDGLIRPGEDRNKDASTIEERRHKWVQARFPEIVGKTVVTVVFDEAQTPNPEAHSEA